MAEKLLTNYKIEVRHPVTKIVRKYLYVCAHSKSEAKKLAKIIYNFSSDSLHSLGRAIIDND